MKIVVRVCRCMFVCTEMKYRLIVMLQDLFIVDVAQAVAEIVKCLLPTNN